MKTPIELPSIESLPQTICRQCGRSLINGLFTPIELECKYPQAPRCRKCIGEINESCRYQRRGKPSPTMRELKNKRHPWGGQDPAFE
jgi:hypothetical protein